MAKISISLPDELLTYIDQKVENRSALIESLLQQWQQQQEDEALAVACALVDELELGWGSEWQNAAINDWQASAT
jgi:Arc/MetJ-type ribon-helix-helix transcriptional regulator